MAIQSISYSTKVDLNSSTVADINKVQASDMNEIKTVVNGNATELTNTRGFLLWENTNPQAISTTTLTLSSSDYDCYEILFTYGNSLTSTAMLSTGKVKKGYGTTIQFVYYSGGIQLRKRDVTYVSDTSITIGASDGSDTNNNGMIPRYIIGYKLGIF